MTLERASLILLAAVASFAIAPTLVGCEKKSETEKAIDKAADNIEDAADDVGDAIEDAGDRVKDAVKK